MYHYYPFIRKDFDTPSKVLPFFACVWNTAGPNEIFTLSFNRNNGTYANGNSELYFLKETWNFLEDTKRKVATN